MTIAGGWGDESEGATVIPADVESMARLHRLLEPRLREAMTTESMDVG